MIGHHRVNVKYFVILSLFATVGIGFPGSKRYERTPLRDSVDKAAMKILQQSFENANDKNVIESPVAALTIFMVYSASTKGESREEIIQQMDVTDYKQGHWYVAFGANETEEKDFYVDELKTVKKPMMMSYDYLFYHENVAIGAKMVELPYKEGGFRMVVVLPNKKDGLEDVIEKLSETGILDDVFALRLAKQKIALEMPKFEVKTNLDLKKMLPKVGVSHVFSEGAHGIVLKKTLNVSEAFVKGDKEGATAGAFTGDITNGKSLLSVPEPSLQFKVDHPFMFGILHEDILLFIGTYTH